MTDDLVVRRLGGGWGLVVSPVFKTGVTRLRRVGWVRFPHSPASARCATRLAIVLSLTIGATSPAIAQGTDTVRAEVVPVPTRPPISPRRAFLRSLLIPGYGQIALDRSVAAGIFAFVEVSALGMARRSALNLREAKRAPRDSIVDRYEIDPLTGAPVVDPETGQPRPVAFRTVGLRDRIKARRTHYEDWIAVLIFNHFFAAADAYVAAHLWDFPARVSFDPRGRRFTTAVVVGF
jgi:hypothetical protein